MSSQSVIFRFPRGPEVVYTERPPAVGDVLNRGGQSWEVVAVAPDQAGNVNVTLRTLSDAPESSYSTGEPVSV